MHPKPAPQAGSGSLRVRKTKQSVVGARDVALRAQRGRQRLPYDRLSLMIIPLITRWDGRVEQAEGEAWLVRIEKEMECFYRDWVPKETELRGVLESLRIPHVAYFGFGEKLPVLSHSLTDTELPGYYYSQL